MAFGCVMLWNDTDMLSVRKVPQHPVMLKATEYEWLTKISPICKRAQN